MPRLSSLGAGEEDAHVKMPMRCGQKEKEAFVEVFTGLKVCMIIKIWKLC
jgi:hypothetical protein